MPSSAEMVTSRVSSMPDGLVGHAHDGGHRHDFGVEQARGLGGGGALLAAHAVFVLALALML
jgi:hypothetical protein